MSHAASEVETTENGIEEGSTTKRRESSRNTSRRSRSESTGGSPHVTDSSISLYKTEPCQSFTETGYCRYGLKCRFAHGQADIRPLARHKKYKTELCKTYAKSGFCPYGARCRFVHEESERETSRTASPATHGVDSSPFVASAAGDPSPAMSPFVAPSPSPNLSSTLALTPASESTPPIVLPPPQVATHHVPVRRPGSPALTPIGTPVNKPAVADMRPFDAFQSLSLSAQDDSRFAHPFVLRSDAPETSASLFSESAVSLFGGMVPLGSRSLSVPADHRTSSTSSHVGGLRAASPPLRPPELTRNHSLSVGHHPLEQPKEDPPSLAIPSSILDSLTTKPAPINTAIEDARPRTAANRSRSFDTSEYRYWSHSQEEELATCSSILSHLELHNDSQPLSPSTVENPELFKQRPPLYPKRASFGYDDIATLPAPKDDRFYDRPKTPDLKPPTVNTIISTPPKAPLSYKPHSSPNKVISSPVKLAQTPPPHSRANRARATSPQQSPLVLHPLEQPTGQFESLGRSTDSRTPGQKKDIRLSAFAAPFSSPGSPGLPVPSRVASSPHSRLTPPPSAARSSHSPIVMHLPDPALDAEPESPVLSLLSSTAASTSPTSTTTRASPALSPFPPPFFPKSSQKYPTQQKKGNLRKLE